MNQKLTGRVITILLWVDCGEGQMRGSEKNMAGKKKETDQKHWQKKKEREQVEAEEKKKPRQVMIVSLSGPELDENEKRTNFFLVVVTILTAV